MSSTYVHDRSHNTWLSPWEMILTEGNAKNRVSETVGEDRNRLFYQLYETQVHHFS